MKNKIKQPCNCTISRTDIPPAIQEDLDSVGGIHGLCEQLPPESSIAKTSTIYHALSDPLRMKVLYLLRVQPLCVCVIKACIGIADSKLSYHLTILKKAGLIEGEQKGNWIIYQITEKGLMFVQNDPSVSCP
jgi:ArsR family transcriptional regulator